MKKYVLDSYALIAYFNGELGAEKVSEIFEMALDGQATIWLSVINWGEVYYIILREGGDDRAESTEPRS